ncbi:MAG TPA: hypothetical protein VGS57_19660 [Thermoanaerobaculia bacterium]|jgi:hypothetical protein|nr:hypothetical protein [Thermoanaerobaculia bacterium]
MAIFVDKDLEASPNPTSLPKRVEFTQTLRSSLASEAIVVQYSLSPAHNVWFQDNDNNLTKQVVREDTIGTAPEVTTDRITMATGPGMGGLLTVEVSQAIRDSEGNVIPGLVVVQLQT